MFKSIKLFSLQFCLRLYILWYCVKYRFIKKPKILSTKELEILLDKHRQSILGINDGKITDIVFPYKEK